MKKITFTVPCYNSAAYMDRCIKSLLPCGEIAEILIINDGSSDETGEIADKYERDFPNMVKAIHKENGGHGSGVNAGIEAATGTYFKVVDSDDWLDGKSLEILLGHLAECEEKDVDLIVCNYVYNHLYENKTRAVGYTNIFPENKICTWNDMGSFKPHQYLVMHSLLYKTEILRQSQVRLPEHTFYVDNIFAYKPLPYVKNIIYYNLDLYQYFIGRDDQSVNEKMLMKRIDQQVRVTKTLLDCADLEEVKEQYPKLEDYMIRNISIMMAISSIHLIMIKTAEARSERKELWNCMYRADPKLYRRLRYRTVSGFTYMPSRVGDLVSLLGYRMAKKVYKFQ